MKVVDPAYEVSLQSVIADLSYCWLSDFYG
jgi:hypothetical protein